MTKYERYAKGLLVVAIICGALSFLHPRDTVAAGFTHSFSYGFPNITTFGHAISADGSGNTYLAVKFVGSIDLGGGSFAAFGDEDAALGKFDSSGNHLWSIQIGGVARDAIVPVAVDPLGNVLVAAQSLGHLDFGGGPLIHGGDLFDIFLAKLDPNGGHVWSQRFGDDVNVTIGGVATDLSGNVYITGGFSDGIGGGSLWFGGDSLSANASSDMFLAKFNAYGGHIWSKAFGTGTDEWGYDLEVDANGAIFTRGRFQESFDLGGGLLGCTPTVKTTIESSMFVSDIQSYIAKFDTNGNHVWSRCYFPVIEIIRDLALDAQGNLLLLIGFSGSLDFGGGVLTSAGSQDVFVVKLDTNGNHVWSRVFGDSDYQFPFAIASGAGSTVAICGRFDGTIDFGNGPLTNVGTQDVFVAHLSSSGNPLASASYGSVGGLSEGHDVAVTSSNDVVVHGKFTAPIDFGGGMIPGGSNNRFQVGLSSGTATAITGLPLAALTLTSYPNPFNPTSEVTFSTDRRQHVVIEVFDVEGQLVQTLLDREVAVGPHSVHWNARDLRGATVSSGIYFYRLQSDGHVQTLKTVLLK